MNQWLRELGALRQLMIGFVLLLTVVAPFSGSGEYHGAAVLVNFVAPAMYVIMIFVLPLDMLMSFIFRADKTGAERLRLNRILKLEMMVFIVMNISWLPFVVKLVTR